MSLLNVKQSAAMWHGELIELCIAPLDTGPTTRSTATSSWPRCGCALQEPSRRADQDAAQRRNQGPPAPRRSLHDSGRGNSAEKYCGHEICICFPPLLESASHLRVQGVEGSRSLTSRWPMNCRQMWRAVVAMMMFFFLAHSASWPRRNEHDGQELAGGISPGQPPSQDR